MKKSASKIVVIMGICFSISMTSSIHYVEGSFEEGTEHYKDKNKDEFKEKKEYKEFIETLSFEEIQIIEKYAKKSPQTYIGWDIHNINEDKLNQIIRKTNVSYKDMILHTSLQPRNLGLKEEDIHTIFKKLQSFNGQKRQISEVHGTTTPSEVMGYPIKMTVHVDKDIKRILIKHPSSNKMEVLLESGIVLEQENTRLITENGKQKIHIEGNIKKGLLGQQFMDSHSEQVVNVIKTTPVIAMEVTKDNINDLKQDNPEGVKHIEIGYMFVVKNGGAAAGYSMPKEKFEELYRRTNMPNTYISKLTRQAIRIEYPFSTQPSWMKNPMYSTSEGGWLIRNGTEDYGIVSFDDFEKTYEREHT